MYVNVHVNVCDPEKLIELFRAVLVKEFHPKTGILFENKVLKLKLFFEKDPAQESIYAFCECGNITYLEYNYSEEDNARKTQAIQPNPATSINQSSQSKSNNEPDVVAHSDKDRNAKNTCKKKYTAKEKAVTIPEFDEISRRSNSKSDFLNGILSFLEVPDELQNVFLQIVGIYPTLDKVTWNSIIAILSEKEVAFNSYHRRVLCELTTKKLNLRFINVIASINRILSEHTGDDSRDTNNHNDEKQNEAEASGNTIDSGEKQQNEDDKGEAPEEPVTADEKQNEEREVIFKCMPKLVESEHTQDINAIEDTLKELKLNKEDSFDEKVVRATMTLTAKCMPNSYKQQELNGLIAFTLKALETIGNEFHCHMKPETITDDKIEQNQIRMQILKWTTIANNLAKGYNPDFAGRITATDFLSDLKDFLQ